MVPDLQQEADILRQSVREFAETEIAPHVAEWDEAQRFPVELVPKLSELGMTGAVLPSEYGGVGLKQQGKRTTLQSSMAKLFASETAVRVANEAVQIHGGYGFLKDFPVEKYYRDLKLCTIGEGTSEIQRLVIARQILE